MGVHHGALRRAGAAAEEVTEATRVSRRPLPCHEMQMTMASDNVRPLQENL